MKKAKRLADVSRSSPLDPLDVSFPIVGIGASAGGLEPVTTLLRSLPVEPGMAFVLVQHLDPHHDSALASILSKITSMKVSEAKDEMLVHPNEVYVIAPATEMVFEHGQLRVTPRPESRTPQMPIDKFLISLAGECGSRAVGVILSGTGIDGTRGLQTIRSEGGVTFAQDSTATHDGMPRSAVSAGCVDFVLPPDRIAAELSNWPSCTSAEHPDQSDSETKADEKNFEKILKLLNKSSGIDFVNYKVPTLRRRVERRMTILRLKTLQEYLERLESDPSELGSLEDDVLINVTSFFRDPETFEALKTTVLSKLIANRTDGDDIRIWVPGCSSGEEVYSIVICVIEFLESQNVTFPIKVFATDVSERAIEKARAGRYPASITVDVSSERLQRFFKQSDAGYQIDKSVRDVCVFARQDITQDPPFSQIDLISCRNVLIYLGPVLHSRVFPIFHYALKTEGFLLLGSAESVGRFAELFEPVDKQRRFYQRTKATSRMGFNFVTGKPLRSGFFSTAKSSRDPALHEYDVRDEADRVVLSRYAPSGVVIDEARNVVQFRGHTGRFLEPAPGLPTYDIMQMARQGILPALRAALEEADRTRLPARREYVHLGDFQIQLEVIPITASPAGQRYFVVLFEEVSESHEKSKATQFVKSKSVEAVSDHEQEIARLKHELNATKAYLQSVIEAKDVTNEELRAANEEVVSSNEELQSTNEELETAKEELQSTNEELETVNDELESRIRTTIQLNDELTNLITCVRIPIVIVGQDLRVRRFSPRARDVFNLLSGDVGRLVTDLTLRINVPDLRSLIVQVLDTLVPHEQEITDMNGHWYSLSIRPFRTTDNKIDGAIILLIDINAIKEREHQVAQARDFAGNIIETLHEALLVLDEELRVIHANHAFYETFKITPEKTEKQLIFNLGDGHWSTPDLRLRLEEVLRSKAELYDLRLELEFATIGKRVVVLNVRLLKDPAFPNQPDRILLAIQDVTAAENTVRLLSSSQQLMQSIVEKAINAIITIDEQGIVKSFNAAAERMFGYSSEDVIGRNISMLMPQPFRDEHDEYLQHYLQTGVARIIGIGRVVMGQRRNGQTFPAELGISEIIKPDGRLFTGILIDISERRTLEREVLAIATHEQLRIGQDLHDTTGQELTGLSYLAQSLVDALREKKLAEATTAARLVEGLEVALRQVRDISKGLIPVEVDSEGLMAALEALAKRVHETSKIRCDFHCDNPVLLNDTRLATQIYLIAREAMNNSVKHARASWIRLSLAIIKSDVVLQVSDDGIGINPNLRSNGVGLHIMAYRAGAMGGTIEIKRIEDGGTILECRIPLNSQNANE